MRNKLALLALAFALLATPLLAADPVIHRGVDAFTTSSDGSTHVGFASNPLPAGFFCEGSAPFSGTIALQGKPIATDNAKLGTIDTIVERLDDARFDANGVALTRVRLAALSLVGTAPVVTSCGTYKVRVGLAGAQRETIMRITRENEFGGTYVSPLAVNTRVTFIPVSGKLADRRSVDFVLNFPSHAPTSWAYGPAEPVRIQQAFRADVNGDGKPETSFAGAGNFIAGARSVGGDLEAYGGGTYICHYSGDVDQHCYYLCDGCQIP